MSKGPLHRFAQSIAPNWAKGLYHRARGAMNRRKSTADVFSTIYSSKQWGSSGDFNSGAGTVDGGVANPYVEAIRDCLDKQGLTNTRFVDLGCGDFRIGSEIAPMASTYVGCDVVPALVDHLNQTRKTNRISFKAVDMVKDPLPEGDVCFIRQVLQHLSNDQIATILPKLRQYRCVLITEHIPNRTKPYHPNLDKAQGPDIRLYWNSGVFLDHPPFSLPSACLEEILSVPGTPIWKGEDPGEIVTWVYHPA
jgi:hypothetical protein